MSFVISTKIPSFGTHWYWNRNSAWNHLENATIYRDRAQAEADLNQFRDDSDSVLSDRVILPWQEAWVREIMST